MAPRPLVILLPYPDQGKGEKNAGMEFKSDITTIADSKRATHVVIGIEYGKTGKFVSVIIAVKSPEAYQKK